VLPKDRSVEVNAAAMRRSAGALAVLPVSRVVNLVRALEELKAAGFWIYGAVATGGKDPAHEAFSERACLVLGAEDEGLRPLVERTCDILLTVPGQFESLNVSACAAVLMYAWNAGKPPA
jgi:23S rRNA (guanosine2251-2'-O)-methyltransferase